MSTRPAALSWSPWALLALGLSAGLCPLVTIMGIPMGLLALSDIKRTGRRGRRVALAAIWASIIVTPLTGTFAWWWNANVRVPLINGPIVALKAGQTGNVQGFIDSVGGTGTGEDAARFLASVSQRWGTVVSMRQLVEPDQTADHEDQRRAAPEGSWWVGYEALFERGAAPVHALFVLQAPDGAFVLDFRAIEITTEDGRMLRWPPEAAP